MNNLQIKWKPICYSVSEHIGKVISPVRFTLRQEVILMSKQAKWKNLVRDIAFLISLSRIRLNGTRNSYRYEDILLLFVEANLIYSVCTIYTIWKYFLLVYYKSDVHYSFHYNITCNNTACQILYCYICSTAQSK